MNKRIQLLAEQAGLEWGPGGYADYSDFDHSLFAQLIVWEVLTKIEDERFVVYQPVKESVMKHFGDEQ